MHVSKRNAKVDCYAVAFTAMRENARYYSFRLCGLPTECVRRPEEHGSERPADRRY